jgi:hypothetical protein
MPISMTMAAALMSAAMQSGEPATKLVLGAEAVSQPNGSAAVILAAGKLRATSPKILPRKKPVKKGKMETPCKEGCFW